MRSHRALLLLLALICCFYTVAAAPTQVSQLARRQDGDSSQTSRPPSSTPDRSATPSPTATPKSSSTLRSEQPSSTPQPSPSPSLVPSESAADAVPTAAPGNNPANATSPSDGSKPQLPLQPRITPALGLSGVIFLLSGLVYALIGIKNQWLYIFASAAYLSSLAVTVLIVYLMNPPVTDAVQGAFFVAAAITGLIFGALALVFADITDGLGCLLGGFCLSMWLLSLKAGGLIESTSGRAIFIGSMSAAGYAFSWSHYTRNYGLIGSISFSGATISMLGVDCFSGAGWKEFWLYLWNLNPDTFPLNTRTYPMTKGMKAELAGVVILTVLGIISQLRLWKLIKEHRDQTSAQRIEKQEAQEREEEERGRKLEDNFQKERAAWEAAYGDGTSTNAAVDSCVSTIKTGRGSIASVSAEPLPVQKRGTVVSVGPAQDNDVDAITPVRSNPRSSTSPSVRRSSDAVEVDGLSRNISVKSLQPSAPPPPVIVPLPFKIPQEEDEMSQASDNASVSAVPDIAEEAFEGRKSHPRPLSSTSAMKRLSRDAADQAEFDGPMIVPHIEDDRASSIAATLDEADRVSLPDLSPPQSPVQSKHDDKALKLPDEANGAHLLAGLTDRDGDAANMEKTGNPEESSTPATIFPPQSLTASTDPKPEPAQEPRRRSDTLVESVDKNHKAKSTPSSSSQTEHSQSATGSFGGALTGRVSKVAQSYRTNEWAKHLESAETPDMDEIQVPDSPGVAVHHERPAPVSEDITLPVPLVKRRSKRMSTDEPVYQNGVFLRTNSTISRQSQTDLRPLSRSPSNLVAGKISRTPSAVHLSPVPEPASKRVSSGAAPVPDNTLLGQREARMRKRASSQSFALQSPSTTTLIKGGDDMTLAARKRALQNKHQKPPSTSQKWQSKGWASPGPEFDSHQPKRANTAQAEQKREVLLADWRESIRQGSSPVQSAAMMAEEQHKAALNAKRQMELEKQQQAMATQQRDSMRQSMMRTLDMRDAHREAMRKLQAGANKSA